MIFGGEWGKSECGFWRGGGARELMVGGRGGNRCGKGEDEIGG